jgi:hypothetical protein
MINELAWLDVARCATTTEMAALYAALSRVAKQADAGIAPSVIFTGLTLDIPQGTVDRLRRYGVTAWRAQSDESGDPDPLAPASQTPANPDLLPLSPAEAGVLGGPAAYLLGGAWHGWCVPHHIDSAKPVDDGEAEYVAITAALLERVRLRGWATGVAAGAEAVFTTMHKPGSDSRGVVQFRLVPGSPDPSDREIVAKIGDRDAIAAEVRFATRVNTVLAGEGRRGLFPETYAIQLEGGQAVSLMEAGRPMPIGPLFADAERTELSEDALGLLEAHFHQLGAWYRLTAEHRRPTVADYLYRERYHVLPAHPDFVSTFRTFFPDLDPVDLFDAPVRLPGDVVLPGYTDALCWLDTFAPALLPDAGSAVHGDIYAANMLLRADSSPMLIDPRPVWEGRDRPDVGYGDPVYDLSTLLHGVLPMAAILRAVETGEVGGLFSRPLAAGTSWCDRRTGVDLTALRLPTQFPPAVRLLEQRMLEVLPGHQDVRKVRTRLYIGAATSLAGWLKYTKSLRGPEAWLATYAFTIWYLAQARAVWDDAPAVGAAPAGAAHRAMHHSGERQP